MAKTFFRLPKFLREHISDEDILPIEDVSVPKTKGATVQDLRRVFMDGAYPVGSGYTNFTNGTNPAQLLDMPWSSWIAKEDVFIYGAGSKEAGATGGAETHKLTVNEMPSHSHSLSNNNLIFRATSGNRNQIGSGTNANYTTLDVGNTGGDQPHNNMPPYQVAYIWERIS